MWTQKKVNPGYNVVCDYVFQSITIVHNSVLANIYLSMPLLLEDKLM